MADPYLYMLNAQGTTIATDDNSGGGLTARLIYNNLPAGNYTIVAATGESFRTDSFVLTATNKVSTAVAGTKITKISGSKIMVTLKDSNGRSIPYRDVVFIVSRGRATLVSPRGTTDANGNFRSNVTNFLDSIVESKAQFDASGSASPETYVVNGSPASFATGG